MADVNIHIEKLRLRLRGIDPATARAAGEGLTEAISRGLDAGALNAAGSRRVGAMRLGPAPLPPDAGPGAVRDAAASAIGHALNGQGAAGGGES